MARSERVKISLQVREVKQEQDVGRGIARVDSGTMKTIGVKTGDTIQIQGKRITGARASPAYPEDEGLGLIRMDGWVRRNCGVTPNDRVTVGKADVEHADFILLAPLDTARSIDEDFVRFLKDRLLDRPITRGDIIVTMMLGQTIPFTVVGTKPQGIVIPSNKTEVDAQSEPYKPPDTERKHVRFRCLKWAETNYASDETWFFISGTSEKAKDEKTTINTALKIAKEKDRSIEIRVEFLVRTESIEPAGFPWAEVFPSGDIQYIYPNEWLNRSSPKLR